MKLERSQWQELRGKSGMLDWEEWETTNYNLKERKTEESLVEVKLEISRLQKR
jgi:hypothetical protein